MNAHKGKSEETSFKQRSKALSDGVAELLKPSSKSEEADVYEAKKALQTGKEQPLANYLYDLAKLERLRADQCTSGAKPRPRRAPMEKRAAMSDEEWEGNYAQVEEAIKRANQELLGRFDRDVAFILEHLAAALDDGAPDSWGWRLKFVRKRRGRPPDVARVIRDTHIAGRLMVATQHSGPGGGPGKQESAIADLEEEGGPSRTTTYRARARRDGKRKSHKKR